MTARTPTSRRTRHAPWGSWASAAAATSTARRRFSPAATVGTATSWAHHRFKITDTDKVNFVLQVCDSDRRPRPDEHLGELVHAPDCKLCFDLVPEQKIEG
jgi:hypothetical protein